MGCNKPKYKAGDMVYSWVNPTKKARVSHIRKSDDCEYPHAYKLALKDKDGFSHSSKWINETTIRKTKRK